MFLDSCRETMRRRETMRHLHIGSLRHRYGGGGVPPGRAKRARAEVKGRYSGARSSCPTTRIEAHRRSDGTRARRRATKRQRRSSSLRRGRQLRASVNSSCEAASTRRNGAARCSPWARSKALCSSFGVHVVLKDNARIRGRVSDSGPTKARP